MSECTQAAEQWLPVTGYEGVYEVSDHGRVRSVSRVVTRSDGQLRRFRGRARTLGMDSAGRPVVDLCVGGHRRTCRVSVLVLESFISPRPVGMVGCHNNGVCSDNRLTNLRWDTPSENERDKLRHGGNYLANRTHCPRQHPLVSENLVPSILRRGLRNCLACNRAFSRRRTALQRGSLFDFQYESDLIFDAIIREAA